MIRIENICKSSGEKQVLKNINMEIREGETLAIIGAPVLVKVPC